MVAGVILSLTALLSLLPSAASASRTLTVPISIATYTDDQVGFPTFVMKWDEGSQPDPLSLRWGRSHVPVRGTGMSSIQRAFRFAVERLAPSVRPTGTLSLYATFSGPLNAEGATAEAALAIGFLALLKGDHLKQDITITGQVLPRSPKRRTTSGDGSSSDGSATFVMGHCSTRGNTTRLSPPTALRLLRPTLTIVTMRSSS